MKTLLSICIGIFLGCFLISAEYPTTGSECGGTERWDVKTLTDSASAKIDTTVFVSTVANMTTFPVPFIKVGNSSPRTGQEFHVYSVTAIVRLYKMEADSDIHVVLQDLKDPSKTIIAEFPDVNCHIAAHGKHADQLRAARKAFLSYKISAHSVMPGTYTFTGVVFFDKIHGQTGVAVNGVELHPIMKIVKNK